jgi:hypothetical protein
MSSKGLVVALWLAFFLSNPSSTAPAIKVDAWKPIQYPHMARMARIEGTVSISATLTKGQYWEYPVGKYEVTSGHPMLRDAAVENLKDQWFYRDDQQSLEGVRYEATYEFRLDKDCLEEQQCFKRASSFRSGHVLVEADVPMVHIYTTPIRRK